MSANHTPDLEEATSITNLKPTLDTRAYGLCGCLEKESRTLTVWSSTMLQSTPSCITRQGLLLTRERSRKPASHDKKSLAHSTWRKTHGRSGIWQGPERRSAACPMSSPFEGGYPDLHGQEGRKIAWRQFPRGQPTWCIKGETSRHQNEDQGATTETTSNPQHDIWVLHPRVELRHQTAKKTQESPREGWHLQWDDPLARKCGWTEIAGHIQPVLEHRYISNRLERYHNHPHSQEREGKAQ